MNKLFLSSSIALALFSGALNAAQQSELQFFGNVTSVTCDVTASNGGKLTDVIQLGSVAPNTESSTPVEFSFIAANSTQCNGLSGKTATVTWNGNFDAEGLKNSLGKAADAVVKLKAMNPKNASGNAQVTSSNTYIDFDAEKVTTEGFKFQATLKGGTTPGDYQGVAAYAVTYN